MQNEIDIPDSDETALAKLPDSETKRFEEKALMFDKQIEAKSKDRAFTLIIWLLVVSIVVYLTDTVISALNLHTSDLGSTLIDGFKLFISSLIGYVFAEKHRTK